MLVNAPQTNFQMPQQTAQVSFKAQMPTEDLKVLNDAFQKQGAVSFEGANPLKALPVQKVMTVVTGAVGFVKSKMDAVVALVKTGIAVVKSFVGSIIKKPPTVPPAA